MCGLLSSALLKEQCIIYTFFILAGHSSVVSSVAARPHFRVSKLNVVSEASVLSDSSN